MVADAGVWLSCFCSGSPMHIRLRRHGGRMLVWCDQTRMADRHPNPSLASPRSASIPPICKGHCPDGSIATAQQIKPMSSSYSEDERILLLEGFLQDLTQIFADQPQESSVEDVLELILAQLRTVVCLARSKHDMDILCSEILAFKMFDDEPLAVLRYLEQHLEENGSSEEALILYSLLYHLGHIWPNAYRKLSEEGYLIKLADAVQTRDYILIHVCVSLMLEICRIEELSISDLGQFSTRFLDALFDEIEETGYDHLEECNHAMIKLLLAVNGQFLRINAAREVVPNPILSLLKARLERCQLFSQNVIFVFNRSDEAGLQIDCIGFMAQIFSCKELGSFFYTNDIKVIVDILLREIVDFPEESDLIRLEYMKVLAMILRCDIYGSDLNRYKCRDIHRTLVGIKNDPLSKTEVNRLAEKILGDCADALVF
ncbi:uncharacterized protein BJ171DRAFT_491501 [Polychytrium aggregatum]|uniref:uncharacterized protein n=1 Tax=Polychytrium aggregatum TaxID=110093 RepID=UPI0022FE7533|nr:uncharacterized protein BJ171DRAFT_491501 [Polychytrium aggregatum]KAI9207795.1 hypothetical protein BJ171DRAFT_491501 [Polychytrium aggregatum]